MKKENATNATVHVSKDGPYLVTGDVSMARQTIGTNQAGESIRWIQGEEYPTQTSFALCRCGHSARKPFCDGSHTPVGFDGTETANREPYLKQAKVIEGPLMSLTDVEELCVFGRFCDPHGQVWNLVNEATPRSAEVFVKETCDCPSGRLVAWDNETGKPVEPKCEPSIGLVEDPAQECSGPIWLRGGIQMISSDGLKYEVRNRVTLCRCGGSQNKPFCDGTHASIKFRDDK